MDPDKLQGLLDRPWIDPPHGINSNFDDPPDLGQVLLFFNGALVLLPTIFVALRLYTKVFIIKNFGSEDWMVVFGWAYYVAYLALCVRAGMYGVGRHEWDIRLRDLSGVLFNLHIAYVLYGGASVVIRWSILFQYKKVFCVPGKRDWLWWACWLLVCLITASYGTLFFIVVYICDPIDKYWRPWIDGSCLSMDGVTIASSVINITSDILILVLPQRTIWRLNMSFARKRKISMLFLVAFLAVVCSAFRLFYAVRLSESDDVTYQTSVMGFWTYGELCIALFCSCLPSIARLLSTKGPNIFSRMFRPVNSNSSSQRAIELTRPQTNIIVSSQKSREQLTARNGSSARDMGEMRIGVSQPASSALIIEPAEQAHLSPV